MIINTNVCDVSISVWTMHEAVFVGWIGNWLHTIPPKLRREHAAATMTVVNSIIFDLAG